MSDTLIYTLAADLTDFLSDAVAGINLPTGCEPPTRIYTAAGQPDAYRCGELVVWVSQISPTDTPNVENTPDQSACAHSHYVEVNWRVTACISKSPDGRTPISEEDHEADAECFYTLAYGLYRRVQANLGSIWTDIDDCKKITGGALDIGERAGGQLSAGQTFRVGFDLTDPSSDSSS